jgi:fucose permease
MSTLLLLIIIYLSFISLGLPDSLLGSAWPSIYTGLSVPLYYAGYVSMIIAAGTVVSSIASGKTIRRFGTGLVTSVSVCMTAAALLGFSFSSNYLQLCFFAIPLGLGAGSVDSALNNYVAIHYKAKHMNWLHCFWGIGASLGPIIMSWFLIHNNAWKSGYRVIALIQIFLVFILFLALPLWGKIQSQNSRKDDSERRNIQFLELFHIAGVKQVLAAFFCYCTIETTTGLWGSSYLVIVKAVSPYTAARWISLYYIGITFGRFVSGFLAVKLNGPQMIRLGQGLIICGIILLILPVDNMVLLPGFFMIGLGCAPIFPGLLHETPANFGNEYSQAIMGIQMASAYIGATFAPPLFGKAAAHIGFGLFPFFLGIILIINIIMVEILNKKTFTRRKQNEP